MSFSGSSEHDQRRTREAFATAMALSAESSGQIWENLPEISADPERISGNNLFPHRDDQPAVMQFDMLRTRLLQGLGLYGWSRIGITSPTHGCGKSFVGLNLAFSLARRPQSRTVLVDLDLRRPMLAEEPVSGASEPGASELLQNPAAIVALDSIQHILVPDVTLYDLPPALLCDDVLALAGQLDAILLVADGTKTSPNDLRACQRLFEGRVPLLGVVLNRAQDRQLGRYRYGKR
jgi:protein-tyrosine kinase